MTRRKSENIQARHDGWQMNLVSLKPQPPLPQMCPHSPVRSAAIPLPNLDQNLLIWRHGSIKLAREMEGESLRGSGGSHRWGGPWASPPRADPGHSSSSSRGGSISLHSRWWWGPIRVRAARWAMAWPWSTCITTGPWPPPTGPSRCWPAYAPRAGGPQKKAVALVPLCTIVGRIDPGWAKHVAAFVQ